MYQAMSLVLACFTQMWECVDPALSKIAFIIQDMLPIDVVPLRHSTLLQILISALYTELITKCKGKTYKVVKFATDQNTAQNENNVNQMRDLKADENRAVSLDGVETSIESVALAVAEALCSIDEDNKHTEQIDEFLDLVKADMEINEAFKEQVTLEQSSIRLETLASDLLATHYGKRSLKVTL